MTDKYKAAADRYATMPTRRSGRSGILLPVVSLGLWHNFGEKADDNRCREMIRYAFSHGITHFDLANNYGPPPGSAESRFGKIFAADLKSYRDEIIVSSKAGHEMWEGHYGCNCSRKCMVASVDHSLRRTGLEYFDIFYAHRYDGFTPLEETSRALADIVRSGKALYVGISKYPPIEAQKMYELLRMEGTPCLISQYRYNMFERTPETTAIPDSASAGSGFIGFSPLAQGVLTDRYLNGIPAGSRASESQFLKPAQITDDKLAKVRRLSIIAAEREQTMAQLAITWTLRMPQVTSVIVGASSVEQLKSNIAAAIAPPLTDNEIKAIDSILQDA